MMQHAYFFLLPIKNTLNAYKDNVAIHNVMVFTNRHRLNIENATTRFFLGYQSVKYIPNAYKEHYGNDVRVYITRHRLIQNATIALITNQEHTLCVQGTLRL